jgi:pimeloyl-ACP methyl ester carboxylesterase
MDHGTILVPGIITPAEIAFGDLCEKLDNGAKVIAQELAVYDGDEPPPGYSLETEIARVIETADAAGFDRFHLGGYSGGGAIAAAFCAKHPERLASLTLMEPAWLGNEGMSQEERRVRRAIDAAMKLPSDQSMPEFVRLNLAPGTPLPPPPPGTQPRWMIKRPKGISAITRAFANHELDRSALRAFDRPVLFILGRLSNPSLYGEIALRARMLFRNFKLEIFEERHHFDPPHRAEPERLSTFLSDFWGRAESIEKGR